MFQYAAAKGISGRQPVYVDLSFLAQQTEATDTFTPRKFELNLFSNATYTIANNFIHDIFTAKSWFWNGMRRLLLPKASITTDETPLSSLTSSAPPNLYLDGYFQDERYFRHIRDIISEEFTFPHLNERDALLENEIKDSHNPVSVHIRRGDYLKPAVGAYHGVLPVKYYEDAAAVIEQQITSPSYFIFSDDIHWCHEHLSCFNHGRFISANSRESWVDMYLMTLCRHHIIANSSYSWWGAWLSKHPKKVVIAPEKWFSNQTSNIVPEQWISL
ncbi:alpha-1,2-fucosyltransferase [Mucilaginibacter koreensis]